MRGELFGVAVAAAMVAACGEPRAFACERDDQCVAAAGEGFCEADGWCSFADADCDSGRRYGELSGPAGQCVEVDGVGESSGGPGAPHAGDDGDGDDASGGVNHDDASSTSGAEPPVDDGSEGGSSGGPPADVPCGSEAGPALVDFGTFAIDRTEATNCHYAAFLAAEVSPATQPAECAWNLDFEPEEFFPLAEDDYDRPVTGVDWCDAWAYCVWAGKRLCGATDGGPADYDDVEATDDAWYQACSHGGATTFAYGNGYDPSVCVGSDYDGNATVGPTDVAIAVSAAEGCTGIYAPYDRVHDLTGNVAEWIDACNPGTAPAEDRCRRRGGAFLHSGSNVRCGDDSHSTRETVSSAIGIRCCAL